MGEILVKAISLVMIVGLGYIIKTVGWVKQSDFPKFSKIVLRITLPCALITSFNEFNITYDLLYLTLLGVVVNLIQQLTGYLLNKRKGRQEQAFSILHIGSYNIGAFATPYISGFIGVKSILFASIFDIGSSMGAAGISYGWAMSLAKENEKVSIRHFLKNMFSSPVFITYLSLLIIRLLKINLPDAFLTFTSTVGSANTFMAMLMIGIGLELRLNMKKLKTAFKYLGLRYGFAIIFTICTLFLSPFSQEIKTVLCMLYFSPIAAMISGFTSDINGDVETSTFMTSVSIIIGIVVMPLVFVILR